ncbi:MAG: hypothetical protein WC975_01200 [Phycisphaerae bacterium]
MNASNQMKDRIALSGWPMIVFWLAMIIFSGYASTHIVSAGDTWVALACGRHIVNHGVTTADPFSMNSHIWINQNWLTHVIFYELQTHFGFNALVVWKFTIGILTIITLFYTARILGAHPAPAAIFACLALFVSRTFLDIRPQVFTNLLVAVFLLILALTVYRNVLYIWLVVPLLVFWANAHGGYIYAFIMIIPFIGLNFIASFSKIRFRSIERKGLVHVMAAMAVGFAAMVIFNPYHLTNLTHTYIISVSKDAKLWRSVAEWGPAFDWRNTIGTAKPFLGMLIAACLLWIVWTVVVLRKPQIPRKSSKNPRKSDRQAPAVAEYAWPKIDLSLLTIAALTIYMAMSSRRFIPLAAIAACPVMALLADQIIRMIQARSNFKKQNQLILSPMPRRIEQILSWTATGGTLFFAVVFGLFFKNLYFDPCRHDITPDTMFMRMTSGYDKPFDACKFIKANRIKGGLFNPWTDGGFAVWSQDADPVSGKVPLTVFIDGRAQAAYNSDLFVQYMNISSGGPLSQELRYAGRQPTPSDYEQIGKWLDQQLKQFNVSVILVSSRFADPIVLNAIGTLPNWRVVYIDNRSTLFVNIDNPDQRELYHGLTQNKLTFPDEFSKNLTLGFIFLRSPDEPIRQEGLNHVLQAFRLKPSPIAMLQIVVGSRDPKLKSQVDQICRAYLDDLNKNGKDYQRQNGFELRALSSQVAADYLQRGGSP